MGLFDLKIYEADGVFYEGKCQSLIVPSTDGETGILYGHVKSVSAIVPGILKYKDADDKWFEASVSNGLVRTNGDEVLVLVDSAERPEEIDENRSRRRIEQAKEIMLQQKSLREYKIAQGYLSRAMNRLKLKSRY